MLLLFPVGHNTSTVRRRPWVSYIIMAANILIFFFITQHDTNPHETKRYVEDLIKHIQTHPQIELNSALREMLSEHFLAAYDTAKRQSQETTAKLHAEGRTGELSHLDRLANHLERLERAKAQDELDQLTDKLLALGPGGTYKQWGYIPSREGHSYTLVTTMFVHGGLMHLVGNMMLFFLCGPFVEDRWGRILFTVFYLASGMMAALCYGGLTASPDIPLVGASGAIAAVMGAFLILFFHAKIKFLYFFIFAFRLFKGIIQIPSYIVFPLWFGQQYYSAITSTNSTVAFWAHVGGFIFGIIISFIIKLCSVEKKHTYLHMYILRNLL
jgi:membrane associated rhomboid family serine protease